jgi:glycogen phosphorylase
VLAEFQTRSRIAYFSMEIALRSDIPTYSGGLGVLAGDTMRSAADLGLPMIAVTLVSHAGYFRQDIAADGRQQEYPEPWDVSAAAQSLDAKVAVQIEGRTVWIRAWLFVMQGHIDGAQPVILLDTDVAENRADDRMITDRLYGGDETYRLAQEIVLGIGGMRMLRALGFSIRQYHLNEGHAALLGLELLRRFAIPDELKRPGETAYDFARVRELCCFTTHTPVESGHDQFDYALVERVLGPLVPLSVVKELAGADRLNMTRLALNLSEYVNGVARRHAETSRRMFPGYRVHAITNGVHPLTWTAAPFKSIYDEHVPGWCYEPELLTRIECCVPDEVIWNAHVVAKRELIAVIEARCEQRFDPHLPILGFARRMTAYKRPELLFDDLERLSSIAARHPFQIVLAGKAHPRDEAGKRVIQFLHDAMRTLAASVAIAYVPNYDMNLAHALVSGADVWLNTPEPPLEASGTSGMKAAFNGVPSLSVLDGWWVEGCIDGVTGWAIDGNAHARPQGDARALYETLEAVVLPLYENDRPAWIRVMKGAISKNASYFHSHRMMRRYASDAYLH